MVYHLDTKILTKTSLGKYAINLVDWQTNTQLLFNQSIEDNWLLYQYDTSSKQKTVYDQVNSMQARLTPDKRQLIFTKQLNSAVWGWNFNDAPYLIKNTEQLSLYRNWFIDNKYLYYFTSNYKKHSQLWRLTLANGEKQQIGVYPEFDNNYRSQKLIYTFAATHHQIISGDIWTLNLDEHPITLN